jgi:two-component sensor histidine kinase/ABC-type amino acid transport substrate-binding protein
MASRLLSMLVLVSVLLPSGRVHAQTGRSILVGYYDAKPSCWRDEASRPQGIFIDFIKEIAARRGWQLSFVYDSWDGLLSRLRQNRVDFVPAIVRTPEREAFAVFTEESVLTDWGVVFARRMGPIRSILDLGGKVVGALENDFWFSGQGSLRGLVSSFGITPKYRYYSDYSSLFEGLAKGEVEAAAASNSLGIVWERSLPIAATPFVYNPIELRFAASRFSPEGEALTREMDDAIHQLRMREPERLRQILSAYLVPEQMVYETPLWVALAIGALAFILAVIIAAMALQSRVLRRAVADTGAALERLGEARFALERSLGEKELLVHELAHRVKNNLQLVLSLMGLMDTKAEGETGRLFDELRARVFAIAEAEDELVANGGIGQAALETLVASALVRVAAAEAIDWEDLSSRVDLQGGELAATAAIPFSLILSELLANACRHGRAAPGRLRVDVRIETLADGSGELVVSDEGPGFDAGFDPLRSSSLGYRLIDALIVQLGASITVGRPPRGASVLVRVPPQNWSARTRSQEGRP